MGTHREKSDLGFRGSTLLSGAEIEIGELLMARRDLFLQLADLWQPRLWVEGRRGRD